MNKNILFFTVMAVAAFFILHCGKKTPTQVTAEPFYKLPSAAGTTWKYIDKSKYLRHATGLVVESLDTITMTVLDDEKNPWQKVEFSLSSKDSITRDTAYIANTDSGVYIKGYTELSGSLPLLKQKVEAGQNKSFLWLPNAHSPDTWLVNAGKIARKAVPEILSLNGKLVLCEKINYFDDITSIDSTAWMSSLYFNPTGILMKVYKPDTLSENNDTIIISRSLLVVP